MPPIFLVYFSSGFFKHLSHELGQKGVLCVGQSLRTWHPSELTTCTQFSWMLELMRQCKSPGGYISNRTKKERENNNKRYKHALVLIPSSFNPKNVVRIFSGGRPEGSKRNLKFQSANVTSFLVQV